MSSPFELPFPERPARRAPERAFAVGDVHGRIDLLDALLERLAPGGDDLLVFLGDYVDRGPDSRAVIARLVELAGAVPCVFLRGNHDVSFLSIAAGIGRIELEDYLDPRFGGAATLMSYGAASCDPAELDVPDAHMRFLRELELSHVLEHAGRRFLLTHAGVDLARPMGAQRAADLLWGPRDFLSRLERHAAAPPADWRDVTLVFGHYQSTAGHRHLPLGYGVDTGCASIPGGRLSALDLERLELTTVGP